MFLLSGLHALTNEIHFTSILAGIVITTAVVWLIFARTAVSIKSGFLAVFSLLLPKAFLDYPFSGLENPLSHLLLVIFFLIVFQPAFNAGSDQHFSSLFGRRDDSSHAA
jgi:arabinofuranosyltransferase